MDFENLTRKELQTLAKQHGIKANLSNNAIVEALTKVFVKEFNESFHGEIESPEKEVIQPEPEAVVEKVSISEAIASIPEAHVEPTAGPFSSVEPASAKIDVGVYVEFLLNDKITRGVIKRVNKITCRIKLDNGDEATIKSHELKVVEVQEPEVQLVEEPEVVMIEEVPVAEEVLKEKTPRKSRISEIPRFSMGKQSTAKKSFISQQEKEEEELEQPHEAVEMEVEETEEVVGEENDTILYENSAISLETLDQENILDDDEEESMMIDHLEPDRNIDLETSMVFPTIDNLDSFMGVSTPKRLTTGPPSRNTSVVKPVAVFADRKSFSARKSLPAPSSGMKKTFSTTPLKVKPSIVPKTNAAQMKRLEALQQKKLTESTNSKPDLNKKKTPLSTAASSVKGFVKPFAAIPEAPKPTRVQFDALPEEKFPRKVSDPKLAARKATPNFKRLHNKQFENSKSITSLVERDDKISKKMDAAFSAAQNGHLKPTEASHGKSFKPITSSSASQMPKKLGNVETKVTSFVSTVQDKENQQSSNNSFLNSSKFLANSNKVRVNPKEVTTNKTSNGAQQLEIRRKTFSKTAELDRKQMFQQKRMEKTITSFA